MNLLFQIFIYPSFPIVPCYLQNKSTSEITSPTLRNLLYVSLFVLGRKYNYCLIFNALLFTHCEEKKHLPMPSARPNFFFGRLKSKFWKFWLAKNMKILYKNEGPKSFGYPNFFGQKYFWSSKWHRSTIVSK